MVSVKINKFYTNSYNILQFPSISLKRNNSANNIIYHTKLQLSANLS